LEKEEVDRRARAVSLLRSAFSDALAIYMLSLVVDFDYHDLRERDYLCSRARPAERCAHVAMLFPATRLRLSDPLRAKADRELF